MKKMITLAVASQKGGTGKSTTAAHITYYFAEQGKKVAFINCETQGNSSNTLKMTFPVVGRTSQFFDKEIFPIAAPESVAVYEGGGFLADVDKAQGNYFKAQHARLAEHFDICVIDTPPTATVLQIAPLVVADFVISPIEIEEYSIQGVADMIKTIIGVRQKFNPGMVFLGMLINRMKNTSPRQKASLTDLLAKYPQFVFGAEQGLRISERQSIPEALSEGVPVWQLKKTGAREPAAEMLAVVKLIAEKMGV
jgi:chromosome partitioning protein